MFIVDCQSPPVNMHSQIRRLHLDLLIPDVPTVMDVYMDVLVPVSLSNGYCACNPCSAQIRLPGLPCHSWSQ